jgi:hypothetical protein
VQDTRGPDGTQTREAEGACDPAVPVLARAFESVLLRTRNAPPPPPPPRLPPRCLTLLETTFPVYPYGEWVRRSVSSRTRGTRGMRNRGSRFTETRRLLSRTESESRRSLFGAIELSESRSSAACRNADTVYSLISWESLHATLSHPVITILDEIHVATNNEIPRCIP